MSRIKAHTQPTRVRSDLPTPSLLFDDEDAAKRWLEGRMTSNYWASTQRNDWLLSRSQIALARAEDLEYANSPEELFALQIWLTNCISSLTKKLSLRQRITATAIIFFHRFYACSPGNSFSSTDPALVATACVYVAAKVVETPIHIRNVVQQACKLWAEQGYYNFPSDVSTLAEMEFYLLEDLQFHLVVYHPYRSLVTIAGAVGKGATQNPSNKLALETWNKVLGTMSSASSTVGTPNRPDDQTSSLSGILMGADPAAMNIDIDLAFGSPANGLNGKVEDASPRDSDRFTTKEQEQRRALEDALDERHRLLLFSGDDDMPLAQLEELDEQVLQMAWFVLNDAYRTDLLLLFPPHLVAVASIFLALVLHDPSREKMLKSKLWMEERRYTVEKAIKAAEGNNHDSPTEVARVSTVNSPSIASPPKQQLPMNAVNPTKPPALRGLSSLPPRPSHLPPRPGGQISNASTPVGTPKAEVPQRASPAPESNTTKNAEDQVKTKSLTMPAPPPDAMTFLAALNVDFDAVGEIVQEMIGLYQFWSREGQEEENEGAVDFNNGAGMFEILGRMRESRRLDLMQNGPGW